jgi:hypothetical protein
LRWSHFAPAPAPFVIFQKKFSKFSKKLRCSKKVGHSKAGKNVPKQERMFQSRKESSKAEKDVLKQFKT